MTQNDPSPWMTTAEIAAYMKRSRRFVLGLVKSGRLRAARVGGRRELLSCRKWIDEAIVELSRKETKMNPVSQTTLDDMEALARESVKQIRALFAYEGDNPKYLQKAKIAVGAISSYSRVLASENNRAALEQIGQKAVNGNETLRALSA